MHRVTLTWTCNGQMHIETFWSSSRLKTFGIVVPACRAIRLYCIVPDTFLCFGHKMLGKHALRTWSHHGCNSEFNYYSAKRVSFFTSATVRESKNNGSTGTAETVCGCWHRWFGKYRLGYGWLGLADVNVGLKSIFIVWSSRSLEMSRFLSCSTFVPDCLAWL